MGDDCVDAATCFIGGQATGGSDKLVTTDDGGQTWVVLPLSLQLSSPFQFSDVSCMTAASCVAVGSSGAFGEGPSSAVITTDAGQSWTTSDFPTGFVPSRVRCLADGSCIVTGYDRQPAGEGAVQYSNDGGSTWSSATIPPGAGPVNSIWCSSDASDCLATTFGGPSAPTPGTVLASTDGGQTWTEAGTQGLSSPVLLSLSCVTSSYCWASGLTIQLPSGTSTTQSQPETVLNAAQPLLATTGDRGQSWSTAQLPTSLDLLAVPAVSCPDMSTCFALGIQNTSSQQKSFVLLSYES